MCSCFAMHYYVSIPLFAIILKRKRKLAALLLLPYRCLVTVYVLWLFLTVLWVGMQCVIVVFPDYTHVLFHLHAFFVYASIVGSDALR